MWSELWPAPRLVMYLGLCGYGVLRYLYHANRGKQATLGAALIGSSGVQVTECDPLSDPQLTQRVKMSKG